MIYSALPPELPVTREYLMTIRQSLLLQLEAVEKLLDLSPRTSELRKAAKEQQKHDDTTNN